MTDYIKVEESYVEALLENAAWSAARITLDEAGKKKKGQSKGDKPKGKAARDDDKPDFTTGARQGDKSDVDPEDKPDFTTGQRKGDKSKTHKGKDFAGEMKEEVEEHVCPLCESTLEEALTDEQIQEHVLQIQSALQSIEEEDETEEEEVQERSSRKSKVEAKVKELKAASKK